MSSCIDLIIASEYRLEREAIVELLVSEIDVEVIAQASSTMDIKRLILSKTKADILIIDIDKSNFNLLEILRLIKENTPSLKVLLLTSAYDEDKILRAICLGCLGYIRKNSNALELINSIRALTKSEVWIERRLMAKVVSKFSLIYIQRSSPIV